MLKQQANLTQARATKGWKGRGQAVQAELARVASATQASLTSFLTQKGAKVRPFWIVNAVRVEADAATIDAIRKRSDVAMVVPDRAYSLPPTPKANPLSIQNLEWGLSSIGAPRAWADFGQRGEGIVVANIDTGVQFDHPALARQYRGTTSPGVYDHNYNWYDPAGICNGAPCDNVFHGTHTMGTMVGDDGDPGVNQIGVAPHARWIAAKGCESSSCTLGSLLASAQWILAPTDSNGLNPRTDLRPHIVNNSWGGGSGDPFFQAAVQSWVAAGIFPSFSAGNSGPSCGSANSPGDYPESYAVGAHDISNNIAFFSSRGPSVLGVGKPNLAAPGVSVRSSVPGSTYDIFDGTSMAAPHLSGTVALIWSAAPSLVGDIAGTRALLDQTAVDMPDATCGGTPQNNNVWGEGRLDAYAAVNAAPRGPTGTMTGVVTASADGTLLGGVNVNVHRAGFPDRNVLTDAAGAYTLTLPVGDCAVTATRFGFVAQTVTATITQGSTTTTSFALATAPAFAVSGTVKDTAGQPVAGATITIVGTPIAPVQTDVSGAFTIASVPAGTYQIAADGSRCLSAQSKTVVVAANTTVAFVLSKRVDAFGYSCSPVAYNFIEASTQLAQSGDDDVYTVALPFAFNYYGKDYTTANVSLNGVVSLLSPDISYFNSPIPDPTPPNAAIYAFWDDLFLDGSTGSLRTDLLGTAPNRRFVIEWKNVQRLGDTSQALTFEMILSENGDVLLQYATGGSPGANGDSATVGIENEAGSVGLQYSYNEGAISPNLAIQYALPPHGFVAGVVTDANDGTPLVGAAVRAMKGGTQAQATLTDSTGHYKLLLPVGTYTIEATVPHYGTRQANANVAVGQTVTVNFQLKTGRAIVSPSALQLTVTAGQVRTRTLTLQNTGTAPLVWSIQESGGGRQQTTSTRGLPKNPSADPNAKDTRQLYGSSTPPKGWTPNAPGDVLKSFAPTGLSLAWGVGYASNVWLSDVSLGGTQRNVEFTVDGAVTGRAWNAPWAPIFAADMAFDAARQRMCQLAVGGDNGIHCWDPATGAETDSISGSLPWTSNSQRGLAYKPDDDTFFVGGWTEGIIYHVKGLSYSDKGAVIDTCLPADGSISGLAWNGSAGVLWEATNSPTDTIYELNPSDCTVLSTVAHPSPGFNGAGLEMDDAGNLWMISQNPNRVYLIDSGVPAFTDVPWLTLTPANGTLAPNAKQNISARIDTTGLAPGIYLGAVFIINDSGRTGRLRVPVSLVVSAYQKAVDAGGNAYTDALGDPWAADQAYSAGSWGYVQKSKTDSTTKTIAGTPDQVLFRSQRVDPYGYRFDNVPNGVYQVEFGFAELAGDKIGKRLFDVIVEDTVVLPAHDIRYEVGALAAEQRVFFIPVTDGRMDVRLIPRAGSDKPVINALRVTHRPDR